MQIFKGVLCAFSLFAAIGQASALYTQDFSAIGTAGDGNPENADVFVSVFSNQITIAITNTGGAGDVQAITSIVTGITIDTSGGTAVFDDSSLAGVAPDGSVNCSTGTCVFSASVPATQPYGWTFSGSSGTYTLDAGAGSFHPYGIANGNIAPDDGIPSGPHNPYLNGPSSYDASNSVTFTIGFTGTAPASISDLIIHFGTGTDTVDGNCTSCGGGGVQSLPEPVTLGLTGGGLALLGLLRFGKKRVA